MSSAPLSNPLASIITPTLNRATYLAGVLESVRSQTYGRIEHIVVDGGSTDGSIQLLEAAERDHGVRWISEPDTGMYNAVNKGLKMATGEIVAYLNSDDRYFPYSVEVAVRALSEGNIGFVYGDMLNFDEGQGKGSVIFYPPYSEDYLRTGGFIGQPTVFWRAEVSRVVGGFDDQLRLAADHEYWRRIATRFVGRKLDEVLAFEEQHPGRLTAGPEAHERGTAELRAVRGKYFGDARVGRWPRVASALTRAYWQRVLTMRFLWSRWRRSRFPGDAWGGFHGIEDFEVKVGGVLRGLIPLLGQGSRGWVTRR